MPFSQTSASWSNSHRQTTDFGSTYSTTSGGDTVSFTFTAEEIIDSISENVERVRDSNNNPKIIRGLKIIPKKNMPDKPLGTWLFNKYAERRSEEQAAMTLVEDGPAGLAESLFVAAAEDIGDKIDDGESRAGGFNTVTLDWPHKMRVRLAGYVVEEEYDWAVEDDDFRGELTTFAADGNSGPDGREPAIPDGADLPSTAEDENPFDRDDFTETMAISYAVALANGEDPSSVDLSEVVDTEAFRWWIEETGDLDTALRVHQFGTEAPMAVVSEAAAPDEWGDREPSISEHEYECDLCHTTYYDIETPSGRASVTNRGDKTYGELTNTEESDHFVATSPGGEYLCPACESDMVDNFSESMMSVYDGEGNCGSISYDNGFIIDNVAAGNVESGLPFSQLPDEVKRTVISYSSGEDVMFGGERESLNVHVSDGHVDDTTLMEVGEEISYDPEMLSGIDHEMAIYKNFHGEIVLFAPVDEPDAVVEMKAFAQEPRPVIEANDV